jgi:hypothetical protein
MLWWEFVVQEEKGDAVITNAGNKTGKWLWKPAVGKG